MARKSGVGSQGAFPGGVAQNVLDSPRQDLGQHTWNGCWGSSLQTPCLRFLLGAGHVGVICLVCSRTPDFQKESRWLVETIYFRINRLGTVNQPYLLGKSGKPVQNPSSQMPVKGWTWKQAFLGTAVSAVLALFCTFCHRQTDNRQIDTNRKTDISITKFEKPVDQS